MKTEIITVGNYSFEILIDPDFPDFSQDPWYIKQLEKAKAFLEKHPTPGMVKEREKQKIKNL